MHFNPHFIYLLTVSTTFKAVFYFQAELESLLTLTRGDLAVKSL